MALATAHALQLPSTAPPLRIEQIGAYLYDKQWLLIFDGFEQLGAGATFLTTLLQAAPFLKVLVTTRECLQIPSECIMRLEGLLRPTPEEMTSFLYQHSRGQAEQRMTAMTSQAALPEQAPSLQLFIQCLHRQTPGLVLFAARDRTPAGVGRYRSHRLAPT